LLKKKKDPSGRGKHIPENRKYKQFLFSLYKGELYGGDWGGER
jgi:hypothetical protein